MSSHMLPVMSITNTRSSGAGAGIHDVKLQRYETMQRRLVRHLTTHSIKGLEFLHRPLK
jgi:hypothetical protein